MVVYWDMVFLFNFLVDYLLLFGASRLAGRCIPRKRLLFAALIGGGYASAQLLFSCTAALLLPVLALIGAVAFRGSGRALKLTLLFFLSACALAGIVLIIGQLGGSASRLARGVVFAELPWGVFFLAGGVAWLFLTLIFRDGASQTGEATAELTLSRRGKTSRVRLLRDTGNTLADPRTGLGVPVIDRRALGELITAEEAAALPRIDYCSVGSHAGTLLLMDCEAVILDGILLGARSVALTEQTFSGAYAGLWCDGAEKTEGEYARKILA